MIVADASWIIALRDPDDPHHQVAVTLNNATADEVIVLHPVTFAECLVGPAKLEQLDTAATAVRAAFETVEVDATTILTFDRELAAAATTRSIASPATGDGSTA